MNADSMEQQKERLIELIVEAELEGVTDDSAYEKVATAPTTVVIQGGGPAQGGMSEINAQAQVQLQQAKLDQELALAAVGPNLKYVGDLNYLRRGTYWNRL